MFIVIGGAWRIGLFRDNPRSVFCAANFTLAGELSNTLIAAPLDTSGVNEAGRSERYLAISPARSGASAFNHSD
jgi:hypothetical protein